MKWFLSRTFVVLWAAFGCIGVGVLIGWWWLDRELDRFPGTAPTARIVEVATDEASDVCASPPATMEHFYRIFQNGHGRDLPSFVSWIARCAESDTQRLAFVTMLAAARRDGDAIAARALEVMTTSHCAALSTVAGTASKHHVATTRACVDIAMGRADSAHPAADATRAQTLRFAQRLAIVAAGVADQATRTAFCADVEELPSDAYDRIVAVQPDLPALIERACAEPSEDLGADGSEP